MTYEPVTITEAAQLEVLLAVGLAFVGALLIIYWGFQTYQFGRIIRDTPTENIQSLAMGRTEIEGDLVPATAVYDQPFTEGQCVYYEYKVKEYKEDSSDDDNDKSWQTIESGSSEEPFYVDDGTGQILVDVNDETLYEISDDYRRKISVSSGDPPPKVREFLGMSPKPPEEESGIGARVKSALGSLTNVGTSDQEMPEDDGPATADEEPPGADEPSVEELWEDIEYVPRGKIGSAGNSSNKRRYIQRVLPLEDGVYVYGGAERVDVGETGPLGEDVVMRTDPSTDEFIVSNMGELGVASRYTKRSMVYIVAGVIASVIVFAILVQILVTGPVYGPEMAKP